MIASERKSNVEALLTAKACAVGVSPTGTQMRIAGSCGLCCPEAIARPRLATTPAKHIGPTLIGRLGRPAPVRSQLASGSQTLVGVADRVLIVSALSKSDRTPGFCCLPEYLADDGRHLPIMRFHHGRDLGDAVDDRAVAKIDLLVVDHERPRQRRRQLKDQLTFIIGHGRAS